jgi:hypothetical protein
MCFTEPRHGPLVGLARVHLQLIAALRTGYDTEQRREELFVLNVMFQLIIIRVSFVLDLFVMNMDVNCVAGGMCVCGALFEGI